MISDPSVVQIYELGTAGGRYFMALEYVDGVSLDRLIGIERKLSPLVTGYIAARACAGLQAIHEQVKPITGEALRIVHRDISPSNLLLSLDGDVKIADFGIAKTYTTEPGGTTTAGTAKGKIAYMSPEQARGQHVDQRTDLFALGVVMFEALSGDIPYTRSKNDFEMLTQVVYGRARPLHLLEPGAPAALASVINRALVVDPQLRWSSAGEMRAALDAWVEREGGAAAAREELAAHVRAMRASPSAGSSPQTVELGAPIEVSPSMIIAQPHELAVTPKRVPLVPPKARRPAMSKAPLIGTGLGVLALASVAWAVWGTHAGPPVVVPPPPLPAVATDDGAADLDTDPAEDDATDVAGPEKGTSAIGPLGPVTTRPPRPPRHGHKVHAPHERLVPFDSEPAVDVYAGDKLLGHTPLQLPASQGGVRLFSAVDGIDLDYQLKSEAAGPLKVPKATLQLRVDPWAEVTLDGRAMGVTPLRPMTVYAGRHVIDLVNDQLGRRRRVEVQLAPDEVKVVREKL
jgi:hypothetical protein